MTRECCSTRSSPIPNRREGYTTDDNARALIFQCCWGKWKRSSGEASSSSDRRILGSPYLSFLEHAFNPAKGRFKKFPRLRSPVERTCRLRRLPWASIVGPWNGSRPVPRSGIEGRCRTSVRVLSARSAGIPQSAGVGLHPARNSGIPRLLIPEIAMRRKCDPLSADGLLEMYESIRRPDWKWFENVLAYGNARLPQALLLVGSACSDDRMVSAGLESLDWLLETQHCEINAILSRSVRKASITRMAKRLASISNRLRPPARFLRVCRRTGSLATAAGAAKHGRLSTGSSATTICNCPLYDSVTGGCRDGLHPDRANENQGAESTLSFLMALLEMRSLQEPEKKEILS